MKKLALIILTALVCLCLAGCADDTVTPDELTDPVTPNEVIEQPVVTPNEPETDKNVIMLTEADENTKYITIEFPEDFPEEPYVEPNLVSPEDFDWGEYALFVRIEDGVYGEMGKPIYTYAFLGGSCDTVESGEAMYNNIDSQYKQIYNFEPDESKTLDFVPISEQLPNILPVITESKVIYISEDASIIGSYHLAEAGAYPDGSTMWNGVLEVYKNGILSQTLTNEKIEHSGYRDYVTGGFMTDGALAIAPVSEPPDLRDARLKIHNDSKTLLYEYRYYNDHNYAVMIYDEDSLNYIVEFADETTPFHIHQFIDERYLVFTVYGKNTHNVYLLDLEASETTHLMNYCFNPILSPDMKYLAYTSYSTYHLGTNTHVQEEVDLPCGFYVKNLETDSTAFYPISVDDYQVTKEHQTLGWVNEEALLSQ